MQMSKVFCNEISKSLNVNKTDFQEHKRGHPLSPYAKFSEKLFLTPWYTHVRAHIRGLEMLVFRKILRMYLTDGPKQRKTIQVCEIKSKLNNFGNQWWGIGIGVGSRRRRESANSWDSLSESLLKSLKKRIPQLLMELKNTKKCKC